MKFRNPCRKCLIRACCSKICEEKEDFIKTKRKLEPYIIGSILVISVIILIILVVLTFKYNQKSLSVIPWLISYMIYFIKKNSRSFIKELRTTDLKDCIAKLAFFVTLMPICIISYLLAVFTEKITGYEII